MEFAAGALGTLLPKLGQLLHDEYNMHKGAKKNIKFLTEELQSVQASLRTVGDVPPDQLSEEVKLWARDARELSYDMEDIVDTFLVRVEGPDERPSKRSTKRFIKKLVEKVTSAKTRHDIGQEIKDIKERVRKLAERRNRYNLDGITPAKPSGVDPRIKYLYDNAADFIGIPEKSEKLERLFAQQRIVSVVGIGGLGKTTLAKVVFEKHKGQFDCTAFVPVGRSPDLRNTLKTILLNLDKERYKNFNFSILDVETKFIIDKLRDFLENKSYFIVIDDIWDTDSWEIIKLALLDNNSGSRIIITTRNHEVARKAGGIYELEPLSDGDSRTLFFARIYDGGREASIHQPDDEVSDKILKKCGGIPLAIITMASLLEGKHKEEWSEVHRSIGFGITGNSQVEDTKKIISFSYYDLPSHLRTCLLYLSVFPEDYFIKKDTLIWMWVAEDFVHKKQGKSLFETGEGYFNELVNRSMIQLVEEWDDVNEHGCQVHDMVLDLICSISFEENFATVSDDSEGSSSSQRKVRRLAQQNNRTVRAHVEDMRQVRSFISCGCDVDNGVPLSSFKLVRVLYISTTGLRIQRCHLKHLSNLIHLRYLRISCYGSESIYGGVFEFQEEIGTLKFLQTLDVEGYLTEAVLSSVFLLTQLLCLRLSSKFMALPDGIRKMTSLEELDIGFDVGEEESWRRFVKELGSLKELRVLRLYTVDELLSTEVQIHLVESLRSLRKMKHLSLLLLIHESVDTATWEAAGFRLPPHLQSLFIDWITFSRFPSFCFIPSDLRHLTHLSLCVDAINEHELQILGQLPELHFLNLDVKSTTEMVCSTTTDPASDGGCFFQKLRRYKLHPSEVLLLPSKDDSCGVPFRMLGVRATALLGSEWKGVSIREGLMPTLMSRTNELSFFVSSVQKFKDANYGASLCLEYFASLRNIEVDIYCYDPDAVQEVEEVEASLHHAARIHPNHPMLETHIYGAKHIKGRSQID